MSGEEKIDSFSASGGETKEFKTVFDHKTFHSEFLNSADIFKH